MATSSPTRVFAQVLTYEAPDALARCLEALARQTRPPDEIMVLDNAGSDLAADVVAAHCTDPTVRLRRLDKNLGPAGGHSVGFRSFLDSHCDWAWVMDDDVVPDPNALESLLAAAGDRTDVVVLPRCRDLDTGETWGNNNGWLGVLVHRSAVEQAGVPDEDLVWWTEDTEYLQWRLPRAGWDRIETEQPVVAVSRGRPTRSKPAWKYYYETRNQIHYRLRVQRPAAGMAVPRHLTRRVRIWRAVRSTTKLAGRAVFREPSGRGQRMAMVGRGAVDGIAGRLGRRVEPLEPDRPDVSGSDVAPPSDPT